MLNIKMRIDTINADRVRVSVFSDSPNETFLGQLAVDTPDFLDFLEKMKPSSIWCARTKDKNSPHIPVQYRRRWIFTGGSK